MHYSKAYTKMNLTDNFEGFDLTIFSQNEIYNKNE